MRLASLLLVVPCLAACAAPTPGQGAAPGPLAAAWRGAFDNSVCSPGEVVVFLDGTDQATYHGSMYFETDDRHERASYRVEATLADGVLSVVQAEIEDKDELPGRARWCQGTYTFPVGASDEVAELAGSYASDDCACAGTARLQPYE